MTLENYNYRTDPLFLRNQFDFKSEGKHKIPIIPKSNFTDDDFRDLLLLGFDKAKADDTKYTKRIIHFFLYDYKFEGIWKHPDKYIEKLKNYKAVLSPDFSMYIEMNPTMQLYNIFRNRFCGAYLASKGIKVIPTVSWGDESTFDFCFLGIPKGSTVAVSTYMVSEHGNHKAQKDFFLKGYNEMLRQVEPERIICYNTPFPEMQGNIVFVDYELSSWKYQYDKYEPSKYSKYISGELPLPENCDIIIKTGHIVPCDNYAKGMGSAYGGEWQPKKESDKRFLGKPGEIKESYSRSGVQQLTKIGKDGKAELERHFSDHGTPNNHTNPHDHKIDWSKGFPNPGKPINYPYEIPEFKFYKERKNMSKIESFEDLKFESLGDLKWHIDCGCEIEFIWDDKYYSITHPDGLICISEGYYLKDGKAYNTLSHTEYDLKDSLSSNNVDDIIEFSLGKNKLREVATEIGIVYRSI